MSGATSIPAGPAAGARSPIVTSKRKVMSKKRIENDALPRACHGFGDGQGHRMAPDRAVLEDLGDGVGPPGQADFAQQRLGGYLVDAAELVVEGVEGDDVRPRLPVGDEAGRQPAIGVDTTDERVEVLHVRRFGRGQPNRV